VTAVMRRRLRTAFLGVVAFVALIWGAVDIVGIPWRNMASLLVQVTIAVMALIAAAAGLTTLWVFIRRRGRD